MTDAARTQERSRNLAPGNQMCRLRRRTDMRNILVVVVFLLAVGCSGSGGCGEAADCPAGFDLDGVFYSMGCTAIASEFVSDVSLGTPVTTNDVAADVRQVEGVSQDVFVAVERPIDCGTSSRVTSPWVTAFPPGSPSGEAREAICRVGELSAKELRANDCE